MRNYLFVKRISATLALSLCIISMPGGSLPRAKYEIKTVVIDAGHGGHDTGCLGSSSKEKHVALSVALKLGKFIEDQFPEVKVVYTRKTDVFIELFERASIANRSKADLFISIHCNSGPELAFGTETFVMGLHKTDDNLTVARRENAAILNEKNYMQNYDGFDPHSPEAHIIFSLYQNSFMNQSLLFASKIQEQFSEYGGRFNRGVKQAGFLVLFKTSMPSVLVEIGFLTHKNEERYLTSDKGQISLATSIFRAFKEYKIDMEHGGKEGIAVDSPKPDDKLLASAKDSSGSGSNHVPVPENKDTVIEKNVADPVKPPKENIPVNQPHEKTEAASAGSKEADTVKPVAVYTPPVKKNPETEKETDELFYTVQLGAVRNPGEQEKSKFSTLNDVKAMVADDGYTRFVSGKFSDAAEAMKHQAAVRSKGFADAFVTAYYRNKRITLKEAAAVRQKKIN